MSLAWARCVTCQSPLPAQGVYAIAGEAASAGCEVAQAWSVTPARRLAVAMADGLRARGGNGSLP